jgi:chemotaxis signal transduction protein
LVISLRLHFNLEEKSPQLYTPLLLLNIQNRQLALIVDEVLDVVNLPLEGIDALENILPNGIQNTPLLKGLGYLNNETILVLDPDQLFNNQSFEFISKIEAGEGQPDSVATDKQGT